MPPSPASLRARASAFADSPRVALVAALLVTLALFQAVFGLRLLDANDAYWTNPHGDMGQMLAGELAGLRELWGFPLLVTRTLTAPDPVSLVYTDSIPWLTALLKLTHLGPHLSLLGTFLLLAWLAQAGAMYLLLRACGVERRSTLFAGAVLALLIPAFLGRQVGHTALSGHALQIAGLALAVHAIRKGMTWRSAGAFIGLGVLAVGVHAYHVPPITLMFAAALTSDVLQRRAGAVKRAVVTLPTYLAALLFTAYAVGYFVSRGASGGVAALGLFEMNIVAPVFPQGSALAGHLWNGGWFTGTFDPTGGQSFEGYNYLGAGVLVLLASAAVLMASRAAPRAEGSAASVSAWRRWGPLALGLVLLSIYAVGPNGWLGPWRVWSLPLPQAAWMEPLALFRAHGRFFWTVGYALLACALVMLDRVDAPRGRVALLVLALGLQAADASALIGGLRAKFSRPEPLHVPAALAGAAFEGRDYRVYPGYFCTGSWLNQTTIRELSLIAERRRATINSAATAREPPGACARATPAEALGDAPLGDRRITVVMGSELGPSALTTQFSKRTDCSRGGSGPVWFCGRDLRGLPGLSPVGGSDLRGPGHVDADIRLATATSNPHLGPGWSAPGAEGVWSDGPRAMLRLPMIASLKPDDVLFVTLQALTYQAPGRGPQRVRVSLNGRPLIEWRPEGASYTPQMVRVPVRFLPPGPSFDLTLDLPDAVSPSIAQPGSGDPRRLGVGVKSVSLAH